MSGRDFGACLIGEREIQGDRSWLRLRCDRRLKYLGLGAIALFQRIDFVGRDTEPFQHRSRIATKGRRVSGGKRP